MKRIGYSSLAALAVLLATSAAFGQSTYTLGFTGVTEFKGLAGDPWGGTCLCTLTQEGGAASGAQGWSISVGAENATISAITVAGTAAAPVPDGLFNGGFEKSETTSGAGNEGAVSAIVLSFTLPIELPVNATSSIAALTVGGTIPAGGGTARLVYVNGRKGSGQPVQNAVTEAGNTITPALGTKDIALREIVSCCGKRLNLGFSPDKVDSPNAYDGIVDDGSGLCSGGGGEIVVLSDRDATGDTHVYADISSDNAGAGVQGWSFSIALNGAPEFGAGGVKTAGTPGVDNNFSGGFEKTEIIDPGKNAGQRGAVSAVVLSFTLPKVLPATSTESVLDLNLTANAPQSDPDIVGSLAFQTGLRGSGQPVANAITVEGGTELACNAGTAAASIVFRLRPIPPISQFVRGNSNDDGKINIADPIWTINELFRSGPATACQDAADANDDGMVDSSDAAYLIDYLFRAGPTPPAPFGACGDDPTDDTLACPTGSVAGCP